MFKSFCGTYRDTSIQMDRVRLSFHSETLHKETLLYTELANNEKICRWSFSRFNCGEIAEFETREANEMALLVQIGIGNLRFERNKRIAETDFYALSDVTMSSDMTTYEPGIKRFCRLIIQQQIVNN